MYHYRLDKQSVLDYEPYDGDTFRADIDLGFGVWLVDQRFRLYGIDAPELRSPTLELGRLARQALISKIQAVEGNYIYIRTFRDKQEKYGRWLALLFKNETTVDEALSINQELLRDPTLGYKVMIY